MKRFLLILAILLVAAQAHATVYFVAATGADTNNGISKSTPFLHLIGTTACTNTCGGVTLGPGDQVIVRGGDTWHRSSGTPAMSSQLTISTSGSSGNLIYYGIDKTWFAGASWTRPIINGDNPLSTSRPSSCSHDDSALAFVGIGSQTWVQFDNFEILGFCYSGSPSGDVIDVAGNHNIISNIYFHGWTYVSSSHDDEYPMLSGGLPNGNTMLCTGNIFNGSDSSLGTTAGEATGFSILNTCQEVSQSIFNKVSNGMVNQANDVHDNVFSNMYDPNNADPSATVHGNVYELNNPSTGLGNFRYYNNLMFNTNEGEGVDWEVVGGTTIWAFNNVAFNNSNGSNCYMAEGVGTGAAATLNFKNNVMADGCQVRYLASHGGIPAWKGTTNYQNNHFIGYTTLSQTYSIDSGVSATINDQGNETFMTTGTATSQGYTAGNFYAPTAGTNSTVGAGANLTSSCSTFSTDNALCSGTSGGVTQDATNEVSYPAIAIVPRPSSGAWDTGPYEFSGTPPVAPIVSLSPTSLSWAGVPLLQTASQVVTLTNTGTATLTISSIVAASASNDFTQTNTCGGSVSASSSCQITVFFGPLLVGTFPGTVTITDNASGSPHTVNLSGTGVNVSPSLPVLVGSLPAGTVGTSYSGGLTASGGSPPLTYSVSPSLPAGLSMSLTSGLITGTPSISGTTSLQFQVTDAAKSVSAPFATSLVINNASAGTKETINAVTPLKFSGQAGAAIANQSITVNDSSPFTPFFSVTSNASWLTVVSVNSTDKGKNNAVLGVNTAGLAAGTYNGNFTVTMPNQVSGGTTYTFTNSPLMVTATLTLTAPPPPKPTASVSCVGLTCIISTTNVPSGSAYTGSVVIDGVTATFKGVTP